MSARLDLEALNAPAQTRWGNLGLWRGGADETYPEACKALARRLGEAADLQPGHAVLDVGCGAGEQLLLWQRDFGVRGVQALEIDLVRVREAANRAPDATVSVGGAVSLHAYDDRAFDRVLALDCAYHFAPRERFFREARRVLRPGGRLAMTDLVLVRRPRGVAEEVALRAACRLAGIPRTNLCVLDDYHRSLKGAGLEVVSTQSFDDEVLGGFVRFVRRSATPSRGWVAPSLTALIAAAARTVDLVGYELVVAEHL